MNTQRIPSLNTSSATGSNKKFFDMLQALGLRIWIACMRPSNLSTATSTFYSPMPISAT
jgi:hypothetical protein